MSGTTTRYYVSANDSGQYFVTPLGGGQSIRLTEQAPGLAEQLNEWRRWHNAIVRALDVAADDTTQAGVFADLLGRALRGES